MNLGGGLLPVGLTDRPMHSPYLTQILLAGGELSTFPSGYDLAGKPNRFRAVIVRSQDGASVKADAATPAQALADVEAIAQQTK